METNIVVNEELEKQRLYMRNYMKNRYNMDKEKSQKYARFLKQKRGINPEIAIKYREHYEGVVKLLKLMQNLNLPPDIIMEIANNPMPLMV